ncbi:DUF58 domain-containing protein [Salipaludibacillus keqinensis]|uniref:DUF58 domain-containing protein n=1 Tax=Salipaludibacillus keqinensis TaxID=2045207 RepID=A0A323TBD0_9BACI|nr:DUF58 domain-containing protein [Salipaludibacillus keqinensis]PYZ92220.1 DUF58 domain-containing protein [Salipaludibacillus keqinensis]
MRFRRRQTRLHLIWTSIKFVLKALFVIGLFVAVFSYAMFQGEFVSWFLFYSMATLVILMLLYSIIPLGSFEVTRNTGEGVKPSGSEMKAEVTIRRKWPFPFLYLTVEDEMEEGLRKQMPPHASKMIFYPTIKKELQFTYVIPELKRGKYKLFGVHLSTSDMFGLFKKRKFVPIESDLLVYPQYHEIERWTAYEKHESETMMASQDFVEDMTSIAGAREYVPGDKLTSIDWKVTARANKLMTKEFEEYIGQNFLVVLNNHVPDDLFSSMDAYEKGVELVTSIIMYANKKHLQVGLWTMGKERKLFHLDKGEDHQKNMVTHLSQIQPDLEGKFATKLYETEEQIPSGATLIIVSVELTDEMLHRVKILVSRRIQVYFALMNKGNETDLWERKRFEELRRIGAEAYLLSGGNLDENVTSYEGG